MLNKLSIPASEKLAYSIDLTLQRAALRGAMCSSVTAPIIALIGSDRTTRL